MSPAPPLPSPAPPRLPRLVATLAVPEPHREFVIGDLDEQFAHTSQKSGRRVARRRYWRQARAAAWHGLTLRATRRHATPTSSRRSFDMSNFWRDLRLGARTALKSPSYSAIAVLTLALAIGANTLLFSIASPLLLQSIPVKDPSTLGWIFEENGPSGVSRGSASIPDFLEWRESAHSFTELGARQSRGATLTDRGDSEHVEAICVTQNLVDVWGLHAGVGRLFQPGDDQPGSSRVAVLSQRYWKGHFSGDRGVIGRVVSIDGEPTTVIGVMDPTIDAWSKPPIDLWLPLVLNPASPRDARTLRVVGRLAPGVSVDAAKTELAALSAAQARNHADTNANWTATVVNTRTAITSPDTWVFLALLGVVVLFVLLIACANLANLVLARVLRRRHDFAVRLALGASRLQLIRPLLSESLLLAVAGGFGGLLLATVGLRVINATAYDTLLQQIGIDQKVLVFAAVLSLATPFLFSLWPALTAGRSATAETLRDARTSGGRTARRRRHVLVAAQVALALSLLVVSGLILRTMSNLRNSNMGLETHDVLTFQMEPPASRYATDQARTTFVRNLVNGLSRIPGVSGAAVVSHLPVIDTEVTRTITGTHHDGDRADARPFVSWFAASPDFFRVAGIRLIAGRSLAGSDASGTERVAVINRMAAEKYFDAVDRAVGQTVLLRVPDAGDTAVKIVGVVADTRDSQVTRTSPQMYVPFEQWPLPKWTMLVKSPSPAERTSDVRAVVRTLDAAVAISRPKTLAMAIDEDAIGDVGIVNGLFTGFALLALVLAAAGLYGVISHSVGQRHREIGIRLTLGAAPAAIRRQVVFESLRVTLTGIIAGLLLAVVLAEASASLFYGISTLDPLTFGSVVLIVFLVSVAAIWSPATRAMRIDPARTLRAD